MFNSAGNSMFSLMEYIALPVLMLLSAPYLIRHLGVQQFGVWMLIGAIIGGMGTLSAGFGAATIKYVASYRGKGDLIGVEYVIRSTLTINLSLGAILGLAVWLSARSAALHFFKIEPSLQQATISAIRIGAVVVLIRSAEGVFVSTLRAFESYGPAVILNVLGRALTIVAAMVLASWGIGVVGIMQATLAIAFAEALFQMIAANRVAGGLSMTPITKNIGRELLSYGFLSWIQALAAMVFSYADRFLVGALLGTTAIAYYTVCIQATQQIHGIIAAGFNFLFPRLSFHSQGETTLRTKHLVRWAIVANIAAALVLCVPAAVFGRPLLRIWMGPHFAAETPLLLPILAISFGALALNVVPYYALLAMGHVRLVTILNLIGGVATIVLAAILIPSFGLTGAAIGRLLYGPITWISYFRLMKLMSASKHETGRSGTRNLVHDSCEATALALQSEE
jgi:O-antigen/teichoic acid export membrane protein